VSTCFRLGAALLLLVPTCASSQDKRDLPKRLQLSDALSIALANSSILRAAQSRLDQASGKYEQSRSPLLPQVDIFAHQGYQTINLIGLGLLIPGVPPGKSDAFSSMDARIRLSQDLLNIANIQAWRSSRSKRDSSQLLASDAREVVVLNVVGAYLQALRARQSRDTLIEQTKLANDLYRLTEDRVKTGVSAPLESNRALQEVNTLEQRRQEAEQSYVAAKLNLANLLEARITSDFEVDDTSAYGTESAPDLPAAIKTAMASRADYLAAEANVRAAESQVASAKASRIPTVTASFSDGQSGSTPAENVNTYRLQGTLSVPIFTGGRIEGQIHEAEGSLKEAQANLDRLRVQIETDVNSAMSAMEWAAKQVNTSAANVALSRQEVELSRSRFVRGVTDNTEVVNAQDRVSRADDARVRALFTLGLARANLARAIGAAEKTYQK
jgi:outer membrane protein TolC